MSHVLKKAESVTYLFLKEFTQETLKIKYLSVALLYSTMKNPNRELYPNFVANSFSSHHNYLGNILTSETLKLVSIVCLYEMIISLW